MVAVVTSGLTLWSTNRDAIITRAKRITGAIGTGETPSASEITEGAEALNDLIKEMATEEGMPLWKVKQLTGITYTATKTYTIGVGATGSNQKAPLRIYQYFNRDSSVTPNADTPVLLITKQDYMYLQQKDATGRPSQAFYDPPGANTFGTVSEMQGTITVYQSPDAFSIANLTLICIAQLPYEDFNASTDVPDFPSSWFNALKWSLAAELAYEDGVGLAERSMIAKRAQEHVDKARMGGTEEGSLFIRPTVQYHSPGGTHNQ